MVSLNYAHNLIGNKYNNFSTLFVPMVFMPHLPLANLILFQK